MELSNRIKFYIACLFTDELDFYYYTRMSRVGGNGGKKDWKYKRRKQIFAKARYLGAFD